MLFVSLRPQWKRLRFPNKLFVNPECFLSVHTMSISSTVHTHTLCVLCKQSVLSFLFFLCFLCTLLGVLV